MVFSKCPKCNELREHRLSPLDRSDWIEIFGNKPAPVPCSQCLSKLRADVQEEKEKEHGIL